MVRGTLSGADSQANMAAPVNLRLVTRGPCTGSHPPGQSRLTRGPSLLGRETQMRNWDRLSTWSSWRP